MKLAGIVFILLSSAVAGLLLERDAKRGAKQLLSFISFLKAQRTGLECYLEAPESVASDCRDPYLEEIGFLDALERGVSLRDAYGSVRESLSIPRSADQTLSDLFSSFGKGYLSSEIRALDNAISALKECYEEESKKAESRGRALKISAPTLGAGIVILLI